MTLIEKLKALSVRGLQVATVGASVLVANPSDAALIKVIDAGTKVYPSFAESGEFNINRLDPLESYDSVVWYEDNTDQFAPPQEGNVIISDSFPSDLREGANDSPLLQILGEQWDLDLPVDVGINTPNDWRGALAGKIPQGTRINSYYIFLDGLPINVTNPNIGAWGNSRRLNGFATIVFEEDILGLIGGRQLLVDTNDILGKTGVQYEPRIGFAGLEPGAGDIAMIEGNDQCNACVLTFNFRTHDTMDAIRVITKSTSVEVPEPITILGSGMALGFGLLFRRMKLK